MPRVATIGCGMLISIFFFTCIIQNVFSAHLGRYSIERRSVGEDTPSPAPHAEKLPSASAADLPKSSLELPFGGAPRLHQQPSSTPNINLFEEYMSRGLYTCTSSYLDALGKLHALIAEVYADYQNCQNLIKTTPKTFSRTDIDALDDMLDEWEKEDAGKPKTQNPAAPAPEEAPRREEEDKMIPAETEEDSTYPPKSLP